MNRKVLVWFIQHHNVLTLYALLGYLAIHYQFQDLRFASELLGYASPQLAFLDNTTDLQSIIERGPVTILSQCRLKTVLHYTAHQAQRVPEHSLSLNVSLHNSAERLGKYCRIRKHKHPEHGTEHSHQKLTNTVIHREREERREKHRSDSFLTGLTWGLFDKASRWLQQPPSTSTSCRLEAIYYQFKNIQQYDNRLWNIWMHSILNGWLHK